MADRTQTLAAILRDPEYWEAFAQRSREPIFAGGPSLGSMVPGLSAYQSATDAFDAFDRGQYGRFATNAINTAAHIVPGDPARWLQFMARVPALTEDRK